MQLSSPAGDVMGPGGGRGLPERIFAATERFLRSPALAWGLVALGVLLRLRQYLFARSLWLDETLLSLNVLERSFGGLLEPLEWNQQAPIGFLLAQKLAVLAFGSGEHALRLVPFLAGIASLLLLRLVARRVLPREAVPIALLLFAVCGPLVNYAAEAKQYSSDVAVALLLLAAALRFREAPATAGSTIGFAALGAVALWFSHPAALVLAGVGLTLGLSALRRRDLKRAARLVLIGTAWAASFALSYFLILRYSLAEQGLAAYWSHAFLPHSPAAGTWLVDRFLSLFRNPAGLPLAGIAVALFVLGCAARLARPGALAIVLSPLWLALAASAFRTYPFEGRFLLFLVPSLLLVVSRGADEALVRTRREAPLLGAALLLLLIVLPVALAARRFARPFTHQEVRQVLEHVRRHWKEGDLVYGYRSSPAFRYYLPRLGFRPKDYRGGATAKGDWEAHAQDLHALRTRGRVWIVFAGVTEVSRNPDVLFFRHTLAGMGAYLDSIEQPEAAAYLYDLSAPPGSARASERQR
jgi:4-amino-4-deoxy-L-arabinose transferase-like glycosyltransferase